MSDSALAPVLLVLLLLVGFTQLLGYLFVKLRQPKVVGEIAAGTSTAKVEDSETDLQAA